MIRGFGGGWVVGCKGFKGFQKGVFWGCVEVCVDELLGRSSPGKWRKGYVPPSARGMMSGSSESPSGGLGGLGGGEVGGEGWKSF